MIPVTFLVVYVLLNYLLVQFALHPLNDADNDQFFLLLCVPFL